MDPFDTLDCFFPPELMGSGEAQDDMESPEKAGGRKKPRRRKRMLTGVSKQRRAANERERKRLQIINGAFHNLKCSLPLLPGEENISKIEIVRLAAKTIRHLAQILQDDDLKRSGIGLKTEEADDYSSSCSSLYSESMSSEEDLPTMYSMDMSLLLFPNEGVGEVKLDSIDSGLEVPSPSVSETSSVSRANSLDFPFMEDDPGQEDDVFRCGPSMISW